jgi:cellulose biosynthesis protein BcsQ
MPLLQNQQPELTLYQCLTNSRANIRQAIERIPVYLPRPSQAVVTDYLWGVAVKEHEREQLKNLNISQIDQKAARLKYLIQSVKNQYDYIFIDAPPSSDFFSKSALFAADVVLIPTKHIDNNSLYNAKDLIKNIIPSIQKEKREGTPVPLPIFFNEHDATSSSLRTSHEIIKTLLRQENNEYDPDLVPYFYPRSTHILNPEVFSIKKYQWITTAPIQGKIASLRYRQVGELYRNMAKEYLLDG